MYPLYSFSRHLGFLNCLLPQWLVPNVPTPAMGFFGFHGQQCGYVRKDVQEHGTGGPSKKFKVDKNEISERLAQLSQQRGSSRYVKQKTAFECEFMNFLSHLATPKTLASALRVHLPECLQLSSQMSV